VNAGRNRTPSEAESHINYLEMLAVLFALKSFSSQISGKHVKVLIDNTTAVSGINQMVSFPPHKSQTCLPHMGMVYRSQYLANSGTYPRHRKYNCGSRISSKPHRDWVAIKQAHLYSVAIQKIGVTYQILICLRHGYKLSN
jgi:hypothetical protein